MLEELSELSAETAARPQSRAPAVFSRRLADRLEHEARQLEPAAVRRLIRLTLAALEPREVVLTSGLGMEGCALIDMISSEFPALSIVFLDTGFHFDETLKLWGQLIERYPGLRFETVEPEETPEQQRLHEGPELWLRAPDRCCYLRKIRPLERRLKGADLWISAVTRSQSVERADLPVLSPDSRFGLPKLTPLVAWSRADIWRYVKARDVPFHELHLQGYPTVGCHHCTLPVPDTGPADYSREGRWRASDKIECGLHQGSDGVSPLKLSSPPSP